MNSGGDLKAFFDSSGDPRLRIAMIDGPVDVRHSVFEGSRLVFPFGSHNQKTDKPGRALKHGTHIASILFANPSSGLRGIVSNCTGIVIPVVFDIDSDNTTACSQNDLAMAIYSALDNGASIINISAGQLSTSPEPDRELAKAVAACAAANVLVIAAVGNDGCDCVHWPAGIKSVLAVGATDDDGLRLSSSNWGSHYGDHGILALGEQVEGAAAGGGFVKHSGSSVATAIVTGVAGLCLSAQLHRNEKPDPAAVGRLLLDTVSNRPPDVGGREAPVGSLNILNIISQTGGIVMSSIESSEAYPVAGRDMPPEVEVAAPSAVVLSCADCGCGGKPGAKDCGCGCGGAGKASAAANADPQFVYALGTLGIDFGTEARRDSIRQYLDGEPISTGAILSYMEDHPEEAERLIWTLNKPTGPIYAIRPAGAFAYGGYAKLVEGLRATPSLPEFLIIALPGVITGSVRLLSGQTIPVVTPSIRSLAPWSTVSEITDMIGDRYRILIGDAKTQKETDRLEKERDDFLDRAPAIIDDFRNRLLRKFDNMGVLGRDRALNYVATRIFSVVETIGKFAGYSLDEVFVERSSISRPGSECYDVDVRFFSPININLPLLVARFIVDVTDYVPVNVAGDAPAVWTERPRH